MRNIKFYYLGISGVTSYEEAVNILKIFKECVQKVKKKIHHKLLLGILVSEDLEPKNPRMADILEIFEITSSIKNFRQQSVQTSIHFCSLSKISNFEKIDRLLQVLYINNLCRILQINNFKESYLKFLKKVKKNFPKLKIILQLNPNNLNIKTLKKLKVLQIVDAVLIDSSGGRGIEFNSEHYLNFLRLLKSLNTEISVGFAGGLTPKNVKRKILELKAV